MDKREIVTALKDMSDEEILALIHDARTPMPQRTGYERVNPGETVYFCETTGQCDYLENCLSKDPYEKALWECANYYSNSDVAENNARADNLMRNLRRFAAEHGGCTPPKVGYYGWAISWNAPADAPDICCDTTGNLGIIRFSNYDAARDALLEFHDELVWYFTKYSPMPKGWKYGTT